MSVKPLDVVIEKNDNRSYKVTYTAPDGRTESQIVRSVRFEITDDGKELMHLVSFSPYHDIENVHLEIR